jgi:site-specific recombinase XerD
VASIQKRVSKRHETSYAVLYRHGTRQSSKTFETEKAAIRFANLVDALGPDRALAAREQDVAHGQTLDQIAGQWLESKVGNVTPHTLTGYRRDYRNWIGPWLGHREAATINEADVQALVDHMQTKLSPKSVAERHAILHQIYRWASARSRAAKTGVTHNPCKETSLPRREKSEPKGLRLPELHALLDAAARIDPDAGDLIAFMASTGWRFSEAVALTAGAVEDDGRQVYVTMERVLRRQVGIVEGGKSRAARRRLRVLGPGVPVVRRLVVGKGPGDLLFTFADGRTGVDRRHPWNKNALRDIRWPRIVAAAGLADRKPTPHWLRHSHVAVCHAAGLSLAEIQRRLGHEDIRMTINLYGRMIDDMDDAAADRLDALLTPGALPQVVRGETAELESQSTSSRG